MSDHNNDLSVLFPNHFPEGGKSALNWPLSGDISAWLTKSIDKVGIQVVFRSFAFIAAIIKVCSQFWPQSDTGMIICNTKTIINFRSSKKKAPLVEDVSKSGSREKKGGHGGLFSCASMMTNVFCGCGQRRRSEAAARRLEKWADFHREGAGYEVFPFPFSRLPFGLSLGYLHVKGEKWPIFSMSVFPGTTDPNTLVDTHKRIEKCPPLVST